MEKEFVNYNQALKLKELGFDEPCLAYYQKSAVIGDDTTLPIQIRNKASNFNDNEYSKMGVPFCSAPTFSQAFRWFRKKYGLVFNLVGSGPYYPSIALTYVDGDSDIELYEFDTYEEAELACLDKLIEIVETK